MTLHRVLGGERRGVRHHPHVRVVRVQRVDRRVDLRPAHVLGLVQQLPLQVREVDDVEVDEADRADAGEREVDRHRRAEPAGAHDQHLRVAQLALPDRSDLRHDDVPRVAHRLVGRERHARGGGAAVAGAIRRPAGQRRDHRHLVTVAERRRGAVQVLDLAVVDVDVDVRRHLAMLVKDQHVEAREPLSQHVEHLADARTFGLDVLAVRRQPPERRGDIHTHRHA